MTGDERVFAHGRAAGVSAPAGYSAVFHTGYNAHIGPVFGRFGAEDGAASHFLFQVEERHLNGGGFVHGGLLMSLADIAIGATVSHTLAGAAASTVSLNCDFLAGGKPGDAIEMAAQITRRTRSVVFAAGQVFAVRDGGRVLLLTASGVWKIIGAA